MSTISTTSNFSQHLSYTHVISSSVFPAQSKMGAIFHKSAETVFPESAFRYSGDLVLWQEVMTGSSV